MPTVLLSGALAGALFGLFKIASASTEAPLASGGALLLFGASGLLAAAAELALVFLSRALTRRISGEPRRRLAVSVIAGLLLAPLSFALVDALFSGRRASALNGRLALVLLLTATAVLTTAFAFLVGLRLAAHLQRPPRGGNVQRFWLVALFAAAGAAFLTIDAMWLVRRYDAIHIGLSAAVFALLQAAAYTALHLQFPGRPRPRGLSFAGTCLLIVLAGGVSVGYLHHDRGRDLRRVLAGSGVAGRGLLDLALAGRNSQFAIAPPSQGSLAGRPPVFDPGAARLMGADVILITVDALRADHLGLYGYHRATSPTLDQLARQAIVFERAYASSPHTSFSLTSLLTGRHTWSLGRARKLDGLPTLADGFRGAGYQTVGLYPPAVFFVETELFQDLQRRRFGFEETRVAAHEDARDAAQQTDEAIARLEDAGKQPLFLWVHYFGPHEPYVSHPELGDGGFGRRDIDRYDEEIRRVDWELSRLLAYLARRRPGAIVALTADHGEEFGDHGGSYHGTTLYEEQVRVPLILRVPGAAPRRVAAPVSTVDLLPTIVELTGIPWDAPLEGQSLRGTIDMTRPPPDVFAELDGLKMIRRGRHKLLCDVSRDFCQLYDLVNDPGERSDIARRSPRLRDDLRASLITWLRRAPAATATASASTVEDLLERAARFETEAIARLTRLLEEDATAGKLRESDRDRAAALLARLPYPGKVASLSRLLSRHSDAEVRDWAVIGLGLEGQRTLLGGLWRIRPGGDDGFKRAYRALALATLGDPGATDELVAVLPGLSDVSLRCRVAKALGDRRRPAALAALIEAYPVVRSRICVAQALAALAAPEAVPFLNSRLADETYTHVRAALAEAVARSDRQAAIPVLRELFRTEAEDSVAALAARLLVDLGAGIPLARRKSVAVPPDARELWVVPSRAAGSSVRIRLSDSSRRRTASRLTTPSGRSAYALSLPDPRSPERPIRAFGPRGHALFR